MLSLVSWWNCFFLCDAVHYFPCIMSSRHAQFGQSIETASFYVMQCTTVPTVWGSWHAQFGQLIKNYFFLCDAVCYYPYIMSSLVGQ